MRVPLMNFFTSLSSFEKEILHCTFKNKKIHDKQMLTPPPSSPPRIPFYTVLFIKQNKAHENKIKHGPFPPNIITTIKINHDSLLHCYTNETDTHNYYKFFRASHTYYQRTNNESYRHTCRTNRRNIRSTPLRRKFRRLPANRRIPRRFQSNRRFPRGRTRRRPSRGWWSGSMRSCIACRAKVTDLSQRTLGAVGTVCLTFRIGIVNSHTAVPVIGPIIAGIIQRGRRTNWNFGREGRWSARCDWRC